MGWRRAEPVFAKQQAFLKGIAFSHRCVIVRDFDWRLHNLIYSGLVAVMAVMIDFAIIAHTTALNSFYF